MEVIQKDGWELRKEKVHGYDGNSYQERWQFVVKGNSWNEFDLSCNYKFEWTFDDDRDDKDGNDEKTEQDNIAQGKDVTNDDQLASFKLV